ncbi:hypothetical protein Bca101_043138 [Brassica carinata]
MMVWVDQSPMRKIVISGEWYHLLKSGKLLHFANNGQANAHHPVRRHHLFLNLVSPLLKIPTEQVSPPVIAVLIHVLLVKSNDTGACKEVAVRGVEKN